MIPAQEAEQRLHALHESLQYSNRTEGSVANVIAEAQVLATLALATAIDGLSHDLHDALRGMTATIGDISDS